MADAVAMSLWPSRGLAIEGFEIKTSRRDWTREIEDPGKADVIGRLCDRWWIVAGSDDIVQAGELPAAWGLMVPHGPAELAVRTAAKDNPAPDAPSRDFIAAILQRAWEAQPSQAELQAARAEGVDAGHLQVAEGTARMRAEWTELHARVRAFEEASGVSLSGDPWKAGQIGRAVQAVLTGGHEAQVGRLERLAWNIERVLKQIQGEIGTLKAATGGNGGTT